MIDFSTVREIAIPEGTVIKITSGSVLLWERPGLLPSAYQQVSYIATDGNQYIDTGVLASNYNDGIQYVLRGNVTQYQSTSNIYWFGALAGGSRSGNICSMNKNLLLIAGGTGNSILATSLPNTGKDFELVVKGTSKTVSNFTATLDGSKFGKSSTSSNSEMPNANIYLFAAFGTGALNTANMKYYGRLYSFTMDSVEGTPIRNFIPCYRKADNVIGLYDTVERKFYTNIGTGSFTKGENM